MLEEVFHRLIENLIGRASGPMKLRLLIQPAMALIFAIRAGLRDARNGEPPFLWAAFTGPGRPTELLRRGFKDVRNVFIMSLLLDSIYQLIVRRGVFVLELLLTATTLAVLPYFVSRGLVTRVARGAGYGNPGGSTDALRGGKHDD